MKSDSSDILSSLKNLTPDEWDRLRLRLWKRFGGQLRSIPEAPSPDDLLHDAVVDLSEERRHCKLDKVSLLNCLFGIVRSKVSHIQAQWQRNLEKNQQTVPIDAEKPDTQPLADFYGRPAGQNDPKEGFSPESSATSELYDDIRSLTEDDELLRQMVEYRYNHQDDNAPKAQEIADALGVPVREIYNANRRLKSLLIKFKQRSEQEK
ncbi:hypothetical protein [Desulfonema magnum]|uniref:Uncharacterized protein n=1 Tax=Desulfonema magnum TaxID=45655 RepID=A0A975BW99_9BACT|nr:hypothetical protein [Desulfonema magnum]QTA92960.1 Uncharacterized protein dnm_090530 [Desulfonema magnum]